MLKKLTRLFIILKTFAITNKYYNIFGPFIIYLKNFGRYNKYYFIIDYIKKNVCLLIFGILKVSVEELYRT